MATKRSIVLAACMLGSLTALEALGGAADTNLGVAIEPFTFPRADGRIAAFRVTEAVQGADLNGDGDQLDSVAQVFDARTRATRTLDPGAAFGDPLVRGRLVVLETLENLETDLNGDGDQLDTVPQVFDTERRSLRNLRVASESISPLLIDERRLAFSVSELGQGETDLNGDGDAIDS